MGANAFRNEIGKTPHARQRSDCSHLCGEKNRHVQCGLTGQRVSKRRRAPKVPGSPTATFGSACDEWRRRGLMLRLIVDYSAALTMSFLLCHMRSLTAPFSPKWRSVKMTKITERSIKRLSRRIAVPTLAGGSLGGRDKVTRSVIPLSVLCCSFVLRPVHSAAFEPVSCFCRSLSTGSKTRKKKKKYLVS